MNYKKIVFFFAIIVAVIAIAPNFSLALEAVDPGDSTNLPSAQDPGDSAGPADSNLPSAQDPGDSAGPEDSGLPSAQDPGDSAGPGDSNNNPNPNNGSGGGGRSGGSVTRTLQISNIQVTSAGSTVSTVTLVRGNSYNFSWNPASVDGSTTLDLVNVSSGSSILVGTSANTRGINTLSWTVPLSATLGDYILRFADSNNLTTNASDLYKIVVRPRTSSNSNNEILGIGGGDLAFDFGEDVVSTEDLSPESNLESENGEAVATTQTASAIDAFRDFLGNKYMLWFFILLLIITGSLVIQERRSKNF